MRLSSGLDRCNNLRRGARITQLVLLLFFAIIARPYAQSLQQDSLAPEFYGIGSNNVLINLADVLGAQAFYKIGVYGQNTTSWVVDAQLAGSNLFPAENFTNLAYTYAASDVITTPGDHATWCAALLGGYAPPGYYLNTGLAPGTTLGSGALATSTNRDGSFGISTNSITAYNYAATHGNVLSTSIGDSSDTSGTGFLSGLLDSLAFSNPNTTMVAAAGNSGAPTNGMGTVGGAASGYNSISVGALDGPTNYGTVASFSSRGPLPTAWYDGTNTFEYKNGAGVRPGVDLVAPGASIFMPSTMSIVGTNVSATGYLIAGTSFATPLVAGGAALLDSTAKSAVEFTGITNAATQSVVIKAVLMNSADKLPGWDNGQQITNGVITTTQALDYAMGAGRMNLNAAFAQYTTSADVTTSPGMSYSGFTDSVSGAGWGYGTALLGSSNSYRLLNQLYAGQQLAVTLCWMRDRTWNSEICDYLDVAQAELDLLVYRLSGGVETLVAKSISPVSTTQELYFPLSATGTYVIRVGYSTNLFDLSGSYSSQPYGIAWSVYGVPEPGTVMLVVAGGLLLLVLKKRRMFLQVSVPDTRITHSSGWRKRGKRDTNSS